MHGSKTHYHRQGHKQSKGVQNYPSQATGFREQKITCAARIAQPVKCFRACMRARGACRYNACAHQLEAPHTMRAGCRFLRRSAACSPCCPFQRCKHQNWHKTFWPNPTFTLWSDSQNSAYCAMHIGVPQEIWSTQHQNEVKIVRLPRES